MSVVPALGDVLHGLERPPAPPLPITYIVAPVHLLLVFNLTSVTLTYVWYIGY